MASKSLESQVLALQEGHLDSLQELGPRQVQRKPQNITCYITFSLRVFRLL